MIAESARLYPGVHVGDGVEIQDFVIVGVPSKSVSANAVTRLGNGVILRSHTVIYAGVTMSRSAQTGHAAQIREMTELGENVSVGSHSVIEHHVRIGDGVRIHSQVFVPEFSVLEEAAWLGPNVVLTNARFPLGRDIKNRLQGPIIEAGAILCANCTILPGVRIGKRAIVGAGSVVVRDVEAGSVVVGNPARRIKGVEELRYRDGVRPYENVNGQGA